MSTSDDEHRERLRLSAYEDLNDARSAVRALCGGREGAMVLTKIDEALLWLGAAVRAEGD